MMLLSILFNSPLLDGYNIEIRKAALGFRGHNLYLSLFIPLLACPMRPSPGAAIPSHTEPDPIQSYPTLCQLRLSAS